MALNIYYSNTSSIPLSTRVKNGIKFLDEIALEGTVPMNWRHILKRKWGDVRFGRFYGENTIPNILGAEQKLKHVWTQYPRLGFRLTLYQIKKSHTETSRALRKGWESYLFKSRRTFQTGIGNLHEEINGEVFNYFKTSNGIALVSRYDLINNNTKIYKNLESAKRKVRKIVNGPPLYRSN